MMGIIRRCFEKLGPSHQMVVAAMVGVTCSACAAQRVAPEPVGKPEAIRSAARAPAIPWVVHGGLRHRGLVFGVLGANVAARPRTSGLELAADAGLFAARNEVEPFQVLVLGVEGVHDGLELRLTAPLTGAGTIPAANVTIYRELGCRIGTRSTCGPTPGEWPDPLLPDVDTYVGEKRRAFPFAVTKGQATALWVDILVPIDATPGVYRSSIELLQRGQSLGRLPLTLTVGNFVLPSTASLHTAYGMDADEPCKAHTGTVSCATTWDENAAYALRERYVRAGLDHRFTISTIFFQPPHEPYPELERWMLPLVEGTGHTRLPGAKVTAVTLNAAADKAAPWLQYAQRHGFADRLISLPMDGLGDDTQRWAAFEAVSKRFHGDGQRARVAVVSPIEPVLAHDAADSVDILISFLNDIYSEGESPTLASYPAYTQWIDGPKHHELWGIVPCLSRSCGGCRNVWSKSGQAGWPSRDIDSQPIQQRALGWIAFLDGLSGEFRYNVAARLAAPQAIALSGGDACSFPQGAEDTLFYAGVPAVIGGKTNIPLESLRMKLIREGLEDYEYLALAAKIDPAATKQIARQLFPGIRACAPTPEAFAAARRQLFELLNR